VFPFWVTPTIDIEPEKIRTAIKKQKNRQSLRRLAVLKVLQKVCSIQKAVMNRN
jgi:hypothetical protein